MVVGSQLDLPSAVVRQPRAAVDVQVEGVSHLAKLTIQELAICHHQ